MKKIKLKYYNNLKKYKKYKAYKRKKKNKSNNTKLKSNNQNQVTFIYLRILFLFRYFIYNNIIIIDISVLKSEIIEYKKIIQE